MVRPVDMQVNLLKLEEITLHQKNIQTQARENDQDRVRETERLKDKYISTITRTERAEQEGIVKEREEEKKRSRENAEQFKEETEKSVEKRINIIT
jgi:hypothetical protein